MLNNNEDTKSSDPVSSLGRRIADSKPFAKAFNDPVWDWATQRWKGTIIRDNGCNYYDFSCLRPILIHELRLPIVEALRGDLKPLNKVVNDIDPSLLLNRGDLLQIGKSKNRGLFIVSTHRLLPITQLLGGNGFGEIPLNYTFDLFNDKSQEYDSDHWTFQNHPIINHVPYLKDINRAGEPLNCQNIRIGGQSFTISEGSDSLNHPYTYLDFDNNEFFTLPAGIKQRFDTEIDRIVTSFIAGEIKTFIEPPNTAKTALQKVETALQSRKSPWHRQNKWTKKDTPKAVAPKAVAVAPKAVAAVVPRIPIMIKLKPNSITPKTTESQGAMKQKIIINIRPRSPATVTTPTVTAVHVQSP